MPIRINLLAESQAQEELRRRDPVKRAIRVGVLVGVLILAWSGYLQAKIMSAKSELARLEAQRHSRANEYHQVTENMKKLDEANQKLGKLQQLTTNRFLNGTVLDALQHATVDDVQLMRIRILHEYATTEEIKTKTNSEGRSILGKPARATEKIILTLDGRDNSGGEQTIKYRDAIAGSAYFQSVLGKTNEVRLTSSQQQAGLEGKNSVLFTLECRYPEKVR